MTVSVFFKKTAMVKLAFLDRTMPAQQHSNSLPSRLKVWLDIVVALNFEIPVHR
jgi:hypothetical protein